MFSLTLCSSASLESAPQSMCVLCVPALFYGMISVCVFLEILILTKKTKKKIYDDA